MIHSDKKHYVVFGTLALLIVLLVVANLFLGSVNIPAQEVLRILSGEEAEKASWTFIVWESRFPQCITALLCGAALSASGLMLQTVFSNPLADSSILGISSGASLGVALVMLAGGGTIATGVFTLSGFFSVILGAFLGAVAVLALVLFLSSLIKFLSTSSLIIPALVASVPIPETSFSCFFNSCFKTNLCMSFMAANNVDVVNLVGGFVIFSVEKPARYFKISAFNTEGRLISSSSVFSDLPFL